MRIILAEDNAGIRLSLAEFLKDIQHEVKVCKDGKEALQMLISWPAHVVLSDIQMPLMDGFSLLKSIKENPDLHKTEVILFTGFGDVKGAVDAMRLGAYDYLLKPVNIRELDIQLRRLSEFILLKNEHHDLTEKFEERVSEVKEEMSDAMASLQAAFSVHIGIGKIGIYSENMKQLYAKADKLHENPDIPVLIEGETGTGKEMLARYIHFGQSAVQQTFIAVNCAALSSNLFESELFGYEAGAFTGGLSKGQKGKIELADEGSIFLDEITEMPVDHQAKLLRVIQEKEYYRVGGLKIQKAAARFICSTNQPVDQMIHEGAFRQDLFYRLNVGYLRIPPLKERKEEIIPLAKMFLAELQERNKTRISYIEPAAIDMMLDYQWPGNVRELKNMIERIALYYDEDSISPAQLKASLPLHIGLERSEFSDKLLDGSMVISKAPSSGIDLDEHIMDIVRSALDKYQGNQTKTARFLGISVRKLHTHLKHLDMDVKS
ncbi:sigma-54-dependent Fis family transcriptional regulator [bacterium]|nr:sigma-54-dependent Fis family transcriptional regulator [bacterium]